MSAPSFDVDVRSLAEHPEFAETIVGWHLREWGDDERGDVRAAWLATLRTRNLPDEVPFTLVAVSTGAPLGSISVCWDDVDARYADRGPWVSGMVVRSDARNLGVGRLLLSNAERRAAALGHDEMWLHTAEATRFYERCGWSVMAERTGPGSAAVMRKQLT